MLSSYCIWITIIGMKRKKDHILLTTSWSVFRIMNGECTSLSIHSPVFIYTAELFLTWACSVKPHTLCGAIFQFHWQSGIIDDDEVKLFNQCTAHLYIIHINDVPLFTAFVFACSESTISVRGVLALFWFSSLIALHVTMVGEGCRFHSIKDNAEQWR